MKTVLVIGGSGGIGRSIVGKFLNDGFFVLSTFCSNNLNIDNKNIKKIKIDVRNKDDFERKIKELHNDFSIDTMVYAITDKIKYNNVFETSEKELLSHFEINVLGFQRLLFASEERIKSRSPLRIIIILSDFCFGNPPDRLMAYTVSKYAFHGMCKTAARELAKFNCTITMISPSLVETDLLSLAPERTAQINAYNNPLKRNVQSDEIANIVHFVSSDQSSFLNGSNIIVNGASKVL